MKPLLLLLALAATLGLQGCKGCKKEAPPPPAASVVPDLGEGDMSPEERALLKQALSRVGDDEPIQPVYPLDPGPPNPLAERFCRALYEVPFERKKACCNEGGVLLPLWRECQRMLTHALNTKALTLAKEDVDRCLAALNLEHEGCDWVGARTDVPTACQGILHGTLPPGSVCRSTLECTGESICVGVGPTDKGRCAAPVAQGGSCGTGVDPLVVYAKQTQVERERPGCANGYCTRNMCAPFVAEGGACQASAQCDPEHRCLDGKCVAGRLSKLGEKCLDRCEGDGACVAGVCVARKANGSSCSNPAECRSSSCVRHDGGGTCEMKCGRTRIQTIRPPRTAPAKP